MNPPATSAAPAAPRDYFSLFELPKAPQLDADDLGARKRLLLARFHPDQFAAASPTERRMAESLAAEINAGFSTLVDPVRRAGYLLEQVGVDLAAAEREPVPPPFLLQQLELREGVSEWAQLTSDEREQLRADAQRLFQQQWNGFTEAWAATRYDDAAAGWVRLQYVDKLRREIDDRPQD